MRIVQTTIVDKAEQIATLLEEHWQESARNKSLMVLKPDVAKYKAMEDSGALLSLIAYVDDRIVGYSVNFLIPHLHYADLMVCSNDVLFVSKEHRESPLGLKLIRDTKRLAKARGAGLMLWHAKEGTALANLLPKLGCKVQEIVFSEAL